MPKFLGYPFRLYMTINDKKRIRKLPHFEEGFEVESDIRYLPKNGKFHKFDFCKIRKRGCKESIFHV